MREKPQEDDASIQYLLHTNTFLFVLRKLTADVLADAQGAGGAAGGAGGLAALLGGAN